MSNTIIFPIGIATGAAFCNRVSEKKLLNDNVHANRHTVLLAPRRYGKTSLVTEVIQNLNYNYCEMDFLLSATTQSVESKILEKVGQLLHSILPKTKIAKKNILQLFRKLRPELTLTAFGQKVVLHAPSESNHQTTICDALLKLDEAAQKIKKKVIIFMDEFQQIGQLRDQHVIEASIRHAVERSKNVSYIFSGSNRHLLLQMFSEKSRPFYHLCTTLSIKRIPEEEHINFIQKHANKKWKKNLNEKAFKTIIRLSECHPYYVNLICNHFWHYDVFPTADKINEMWFNYIKTQHAIITYDIVSLSVSTLGTTSTASF